MSQTNTFTLLYLYLYWYVVIENENGKWDKDLARPPPRPSLVPSVVATTKTLPLDYR